jgi:hypothetical protein
LDPPPYLHEQAGVLLQEGCQLNVHVLGRSALQGSRAHEEEKHAHQIKARKVAHWRKLKDGASLEDANWIYKCDAEHIAPARQL